MTGTMLRHMARAAIIGALTSLPALAQDDTAPVPAPPAGAARADSALLRGLDKITGTTRDLPLRVGEATDFGRLEVRLGECRYPADDPGSDAFAELTITDNVRKQTVFAGWMIASSPAISALDDARYDVWVVSCTNSKPAGDAPAGQGKPASPAP